MLFVDQLGCEIKLEKTPMRIVSLVPSQTELLYHLGLGERVVGITKFCIHPKTWFQTKAKIGGPKNVKIDEIVSLFPDLIIGNKEENIKEQIEELSGIAPVWLSDIYNLEDSLTMISNISKICEKEKNGNAIVDEIRKNFEQLVPFKKKARAIYLIWKNPFMGVGSHTFIDHVLTQYLGVENVLHNQPRYPVLDLDNLPDLEYVFLSTEPYPFSEKHIPEVRKYFPSAKIMIVDGEYFTWYGSRLLGTANYLKTLMTRM